MRGQAFPGTDGGPELVVGDTTAYPARAVGTSMRRWTATRCGAPPSLIDKNSALTAAHCVHDGSGDVPDAWATATVVRPQPRRRQRPPTARAPRPGPTPLRLAGPPPTSGSTTPWSNWTAASGGGSAGSTLWLSGRATTLSATRSAQGYPADLAGHQWRGGDRVTTTTPKQVFHKRPYPGTAGGRSTCHAIRGGSRDPRPGGRAHGHRHPRAGASTAPVHQARFRPGPAWAAENG